MKLQYLTVQNKYVHYNIYKFVQYNLVAYF